MAERLTGKPVADAMKDDLAKRVEALKAKGKTPKLGIIRVGARPDDLFYEGGAKKTCTSIGMEFEVFEHPEKINETDLSKAIKTVGERKDIHGILMFAPLPAHLDNEKMKKLIPVEKDVDCLSPLSADALFAGKTTGFPPCTPTACMDMLAHYNVPVKGKKCVVIGQGPVVGKPVSYLLLKAGAEVTTIYLDTKGTLCVDELKLGAKSMDVASHSTDKTTPDTCKKAEVIVAAAGFPRLVKANAASPGQTFIDVGINADPQNPGKYCGDVDYEAVEPIVARISPVPAGVGSVTTSVLCKHTIMACEKQA
ncbi:MAG: bifunctional 5,10-methylenetetrahydrofolate dehydrogenase/5,10-methenyltetrahydrofolate cyclohydrolase [Proteobacteria bacterium]|nr:bifunctional 5,10-methylenetetrahydrofolate dehydrogenase/5,10-methenyltetrahydrofolate cyclohydrolase [Pseudomonadota bacterium]